MERSKDPLARSLTRLNFIFRNEKITTECINSFKGISLLGESFGPFEKGKKYKLKLFSAFPLIENNILKVDPTEKCDNMDVQRYAISERDDPKIIKRENHLFLNRIKEFKRFLEYEIEKSHKPPIDLDKFISYASNIVDGRLLKILKLAKADLSLNDEYRLTDSEKLLYKHLYKLIKKWREFYLSFK